jgi:hypothetical protein
MRHKNIDEAKHNTIEMCERKKHTMGEFLRFKDNPQYVYSFCAICGHFVVITKHKIYGKTRIGVGGSAIGLFCTKT